MHLIEHPHQVIDWLKQRLNFRLHTNPAIGVVCVCIHPRWYYATDFALHLIDALPDLSLIGDAWPMLVMVDEVAGDAEITFP